MAENQIFNALIEFFEEDGWEFQSIEGTSVLSMGFSGKNGKWLCYAHAREAESQFAFYSVLSVNVPSHKRHKVAEFITRANYGMMIGNFEMDYIDGEIRYKTSIDIDGTDLTPTIIQQIVYPNLIITDHYFEGIMRTIYSDESPADILDEIEFGQNDESDTDATVVDDFGDLKFYSDGTFSIGDFADELDIDLEDLEIIADDDDDWDEDDFFDEDELFDDDDLSPPEPPPLNGGTPN